MREENIKDHNTSYEQTKENSDLLINEFIVNTINSMSTELSSEQLSKLKDVIYMNLHDIKFSRECYELATTISNSDTKKIEYFAASKKIAGRSEDTIKQYVREIYHFRNFLQKNFEDVKTADVKYYLAYFQMNSNWSDKTVRNNKNFLNSFFSFLFKEGLIEKNPLDNIEAIKIEQTKPTVFSTVEIEKIRNTCNNTRDRAMIEFLLATGVRVSELCSIRWLDVDINSNKIIILGKGHKERDVYFNETSKYYLDLYFNERLKNENITYNELLTRKMFCKSRKNIETNEYEGLSIRGVQTILKDIEKKSGVQDIHPHKFRKTFATMAVENGMPVEDVSELLGHNQLDTTMIYVNMSNKKIENSYKAHCS